MKEFKVIEVKRSILEDNDADAEKLRQELKEEESDVISRSGQDYNVKENDFYAGG